MAPHWLLEQNLPQELSWPIQPDPQLCSGMPFEPPAPGWDGITPCLIPGIVSGPTGSWVCGNGRDLIPSSGLCCVQPGVSLLCHAFTKEDYAWGFQRNLKALDLSLAWLSTGFPGAFLNTKNTSLPQTFCQAEGCYLWGNIDATTRTLQEKTTAAWYCRIISPSLKEIKMLQIENLFEEGTRSAIDISISSKPALETRCHTIMRPWPEL